MRPLLVGESNPYGSDPEYALYPEPPNAAGGRLMRILGLTRREYMDLFERVNLLSGPWDVERAYAAAQDLGQRDKAQAFILLGRRVAGAFELSRWAAFSMDRQKRSHLKRDFLVLPHPSGRCRVWNQPGAVERARVAVYELLPSKVRHEIGIR